MKRHTEIIPHTFQAIRHISNNVFVRHRHRTRRIRILPLAFKIRQLKSSSHTIFSIPTRSRLNEQRLIHLNSSHSHTITNLRINTTDRQKMYFSHSTILLTRYSSFTLLPNQIRLSLISHQPFTNLLMRANRVLQRRITRTRHLRATFITRLNRHLPNHSKAPVRQDQPVGRMRISMFRLRRSRLSIRNYGYRIMPLLKITRLNHSPRVATLTPLIRTNFNRNTTSTTLIIMTHNSISVPMPHHRHQFSRKDSVVILSSRRPRPSLQGRITIVRFSSQRTHDDHHGNRVTNSRRNHLLIFALRPIQDVYRNSVPDLPAPMYRRVK